MSLAFFGGGPRCGWRRRSALVSLRRTCGVRFRIDFGTWVRVDVRLIRADNGYVAWSETYDQPMTNIPMVQDDIAGAVMKALRASMGGKPGN